MKQKEQVHRRWSPFPLTDEAAPTPAFLTWMLLAQQCSGSEEQAALQYIRRYFSTTVSKAIWGFFKCLEVKSSGANSSTDPAGPQENEALWNVASMQQQRFPKNHQTEWKDTNHRALWDRSNTPAQPKWWALLWLEDKGRQLGRKQKNDNFHNFLVSLTRWDMLATLLLQCLTEGEKSPAELLLPVACCFWLLAACYKTTGKKPTATCATLPHPERLCQGEACSLTPWPPKTSPGASPD